MMIRANSTPRMHRCDSILVVNCCRQPNSPVLLEEVATAAMHMIAKGEFNAQDLAHSMDDLW